MAFADLVATMNTTVVGTLGAAVIYTTERNVSTELNAILAPGNVEDTTDQSMVLSCFLQASDLGVAPSTSGRITADGVQYSITRVEADGKGGILLQLRKRS